MRGLKFYPYLHRGRIAKRTCDKHIGVVETEKVDGHIATLKELPAGERDHIIHYDETVQRLAAITAVPPEESSFLWKLLAVVFLPSALALRITKISVEIFGWFPKA